MAKRNVSSAERFFTESAANLHQALTYEFDDTQREIVFEFAEAYAAVMQKVRCQLTNHILLKTCRCNSMIAVFSLSLCITAIGNAQKTTPEISSEQSPKIQPAQIQQIGGARKGEVSEAASANLPDSPGNLVPSSNDIASTCGPKWLGGCYNQSAPKPSNWAVIKSPLFIWPTTAEWLAAGFDVGVTWRGLQEHKCVEANPIYGPHPSLKDLALTNLAAHGAITGLRFVILKAIPTNEKSKWRRLPQIVAVGGGFGSAALQMKSGLAWFQDGCL